MLSYFALKKKNSLLFICLILGFYLLGTNNGFCKKKVHLKKIDIKATEHKIKGKFEKFGKDTKKGIIKAEKKVKKGLDKIGKAFKKAVKVIISEAEKELKKLGFSPTEMKEVFKCIKPTLKMVKDSTLHPTSAAIKEKIANSKCPATVRNFVEGQCSRPEFIIATSLPYVGQGIGSICSRLESVVDKVDHVLEKSQENNISHQQNSEELDEEEEEGEN